MQIRVNGETHELADATSLDQLLSQMGLDRRYLVVEYNGEPLSRDRIEGLRLADGDTLELVRPVAGG